MAVVVLNFWDLAQKLGLLILNDAGEKFDNLVLAVESKVRFVQLSFALDHLGRLC